MQDFSKIEDWSLELEKSLKCGSLELKCGLKKGILRAAHPVTPSHVSCPWPKNHCMGYLSQQLCSSITASWSVLLVIVSLSNACIFNKSMLYGMCAI